MLGRQRKVFRTIKSLFEEDVNVSTCGAATLVLEGQEADLKLVNPKGGRPRKPQSVDAKRALLIGDLNEEARKRGKLITDVEWIPILRELEPKLFPNEPKLFPKCQDEVLQISISKGRKELGISGRTGPAKRR